MRLLRRRLIDLGGWGTTTFTSGTREEIRPMLTIDFQFTWALALTIAGLVAAVMAITSQRLGAKS